MKMEQGIQMALLMLIAAGAADKSIGPNGSEADEAAVWVGVGLGYCTAKGWATYQGDGNFIITEAGIVAAETVLGDAGLLKQ